MAGEIWEALDRMELGPDAGAAGGPWRHWRLSLDDEGVAWLIADRADATVNTLSGEVLAELDAALARIEQDAPKGVVLRSAKASGFLAGADVTEFTDVRDPAEVEQRLARARAVVDRLERLAVPTVAVIHGHALGGGLELALACDHRILVGEARLGFPEIRLGLHPGLGGIARTLALVEPLAAMRMMLTGKPLHAREAKALGLADALTEERHVRAAVRAAVAGQLRKPKPRLRARVQERLLEAAAARKLAADRMRAEADKEAPNAHYPAPYALIELWEKHGEDSDALREAETASFARLLVSDTAQNLIRVFLLREKLKGLAEAGGAGRPIHHVHVVGAGAMGGDIAAWCAWQGLRVTLSDPKLEAIAGAVQRAAELYPKLGHDSARTRDALDRLIPDPRSAGVGHADLVVEAAPEKAELKRQVYADLEPRLKPHAVLATNTSSIPLATLREGLRRPERLIGTHFFNPVSRMELVEVVGEGDADREALAIALAFLDVIDRLPAPVKSAPGFLVNRALTPYMLEALVLLQEGHAKETIDAAAERFGMPMGPITLADQVGLDICIDVADSLQARLDRPLPEVPQSLRAKVERGELGRKTGQGLYPWKDGEPVKSKGAPEPTPEMTDRLILPLIDACLECLRTGVVDDEEVVDAALVFGAGFAPFRGGPIRYARAAGADELRRRMEVLADREGERFRPDPGWSRLS